MQALAIYRAQNVALGGKRQLVKNALFQHVVNLFPRMCPKKVEIDKADADKAKEGDGEEGNGGGGRDEVVAEKPLDLDRFAHVWR